MGIDLNAVLQCASDAARAAGQVIAPRLGNPATIRGKAHGPVTDCDVQAEAAAISVIRGAFPDHAILSEEAGQVGTSPYRWIIDPLDGTVNFIRGIPWYDVSVAFEAEGSVEAGAVYAPALDMLFAGRRGKGASLNGRPMRVSDMAVLAGSMVDVGFGREDWSDSSMLAGASRLAASGAEIRSLNACALDLAFVASGQLEGYWDAHTSLWDVSAGILLIEEAGGRVTVRERGDALGSGLMVLGSNRHLHDALCQVLGLG